MGWCQNKRWKSDSFITWTRKSEVASYIQVPLKYLEIQIFFRDDFWTINPGFLEFAHENPEFFSIENGCNFKEGCTYFLEYPPFPQQGSGSRPTLLHRGACVFMLVVLGPKNAILGPIQRRHQILGGGNWGEGTKCVSEGAKIYRKWPFLHFFLQWLGGNN